MSASQAAAPKSAWTDKLHNRYSAFRHGPSLANIARIIVSDPKDAIARYGLTKSGRMQVQSSALDAKKRRILDVSTIIVSSDFKRARESAEIVAAVIGGSVILDEGLRERGFGGWEKTSNQNYERVWEDDARDPTHTNNGVESAMHVAARTRAVIERLEQRFTGRKIFLFSHGDTLQILQTQFAGIDPSFHRSLPHLKTAEVRVLN